VPNFGVQELMPHTSLTDDVFPHDYRFEDGYLVMDEVPGLGVDIDEALAAKYPYERAYLPINRKLDGTLQLRGQFIAQEDRRNSHANVTEDGTVQQQRHADFIYHRRTVNHP